MHPKTNKMSYLLVTNGTKIFTSLPVIKPNRDVFGETRRVEMKSDAVSSLIGTSIINGVAECNRTEVTNSFCTISELMWN